MKNVIKFPELDEHGVGAGVIDTVSEVLCDAAKYTLGRLGDVALKAVSHVLPQWPDPDNPHMLNEDKMY